MGSKYKPWQKVHKKRKEEDRYETEHKKLIIKGRGSYEEFEYDDEE